MSVNELQNFILEYNVWLFIFTLKVIFTIIRRKIHVIYSGTAKASVFGCAGRISCHGNTEWLYAPTQLLSDIRQSGGRTFHYGFVAFCHLTIPSHSFIHILYMNSSM